jgi:hypothetical protein
MTRGPAALLPTPNNLERPLRPVAGSPVQVAPGPPATGALDSLAKSLVAVNELTVGNKLLNE